MSDTVSAKDKQLVADLQGLLDQVDKVRRGLTSKGFAPKGNGCVCEGTALCAHHAEVYKQLDQVSDRLALAIGVAGRIE